ncbi:hypothetical protein D9M72_461610 [compost metagenome]
MVTRAHRMPASWSWSSSSRAPGRQGTDLRTLLTTRAVSESMISRASSLTPAFWRTPAEKTSDCPTSCMACAWDHCPPWAATSACSASIQYGSVSTIVPSMSHKAALRSGWEAEDRIAPSLRCAPREAACTTPSANIRRRDVVLQRCGCGLRKICGASFHAPGGVLDVG